MTKEEFFAIGYLAYLQQWGQNAQDAKERPSCARFDVGPYEARFYLIDHDTSALLSRHDLAFEIDMGSRAVRVERRNTPAGHVFLCDHPFTDTELTALGLIMQ